MSIIYRRPLLARRMARQLVEPHVLDEGLRSGLFLSAPRRTGKTTFLRADLAPALESAGALVISVDLRGDTWCEPATFVLTAIRQALRELQRPAAGLSGRLARVRGAQAGAFGFRVGFELESLGEESGPTLAHALTALVEQSGKDVVLIVDEVQHAFGSNGGERLLLALKAARDAINPRADTSGHFVFVGAGSWCVLTEQLSTRGERVFRGATILPFPPLGRGYVEHVLERLVRELPGLPGHERARAAAGVMHRSLPSLDIAFEAFTMLGHRPEPMIRALTLLRAECPAGVDPDHCLPLIVARLRTRAIDTELVRVKALGELACAVFERIAATDTGARGILSTAALADHARITGRPVRVDEVRDIARKLVATELVVRHGHDLYALADPLASHRWRECALA